MPIDVIMPQMGESIAEGTLVKWLKKPGDQVERDENLFEISTDKVDAEIPSPVGGHAGRDPGPGGRDRGGRDRRRHDPGRGRGAARRRRAREGGVLAGRRLGARNRFRRRARGERAGGRSRRRDADPRSRSGRRHVGGRRGQRHRGAGHEGGAPPHPLFAPRPQHRARARSRRLADPGKRAFRAGDEAATSWPTSSARGAAEAGRGDRGTGTASRPLDPPAPSPPGQLRARRRARSRSSARSRPRSPPPAPPAPLRRQRPRRARADVDHAAADRRAHDRLAPDVGARDVVLRDRHDAGGRAQAAQQGELSRGFGRQAHVHAVHHQVVGRRA